MCPVKATIVTASNARKRFFELIDTVQKSGIPVTIERRGKALATLIQAGPTTIESSLHLRPAALFSRIRHLKKKIAKGGHKKGADAVSVVRALRDEA